jgi:hypothetical protein
MQALLPSPPCCRARKDVFRSPRQERRRLSARAAFGVIGGNNIGGIGLEEGLVVPGAVRLLAIRHLQGAIEGVGMRP